MGVVSRNQLWVVGEGGIYWSIGVASGYGCNEVYTCIYK